jgi:hypothetical protein
MSGTVHFIAATFGPIVATCSIIGGTFTHERDRAALKSDTFRLSLVGAVASTQFITDRVAAGGLLRIPSVQILAMTVAMQLAND